MTDVGEYKNFEHNISSSSCYKNAAMLKKTHLLLLKNPVIYVSEEVALKVGVLQLIKKYVFQIHN